MITLTREEAQQVLDALNSVWNMDKTLKQCDSIELLDAKLSEPEPEELGEIVPADEEQLKRIAKLVEPEPEPVDNKELMRRVMALLPEVAVKATEE